MGQALGGNHAVMLLENGACLVSGLYWYCCSCVHGSRPEGLLGGVIANLFGCGIRRGKMAA